MRRFALVLCFAFFLPGCCLWTALWHTDDPWLCGMLGGAVDGDETGPLCLTPDDYPP